MLNKEAYSKHLRTIILKIKKISDPMLKNQCIEAFKHVLTASVRATPICLMPSTPNYQTFQDITLLDFATYVATTLNAADYDKVQDLLVEKSEMFDSIGIDIEALFQETAEAHPAVMTANAGGSAFEENAGAGRMDCEDTAEEALSAEERSILESVSGQDDAGAVYFLPTQRQIVIDYIRLRLVYAKLDPLDLERPSQRRRCDETMERFTAVSRKGFSVDSDQFPTLFSKINLGCDAAGLVFKKHVICELIERYPAAELERLPPQGVISIYNTAVNVKKNLHAINSMLEYFMQTQAKLDSALPPVRFTAVFCGDQTLGNVTFTVNAPDLLLGYTLHNMLLVSRQVATSTPDAMPYAGALAFNIDKQSLAQLRNYLTELKTWYDDFRLILSCLFGNTGTVAQYTKTGQKALKEIIGIEDVRKRDGLRPLISEATVLELKRIPRPEFLPVLLVGQVALDLTEHPDRDNMKRLFESLYRVHGFRDAKGEHKTFIKTLGYQYVSLLSIPNIQGMFDDLMAQASLTVIAQEMGFDSAHAEEFWAMMGASSLIELYNQQLGMKLTELPIYTRRPDGQLDPAVAAKTVVRVLAMTGSFNQPGNQDFSVLSRNFDIRLKKMLNQLCSIALQATENNTDELSVEERQELAGLLSVRRMSVLPRASKDHLFAERRRVLLSEASFRAGYHSIKTVEDIQHVFAAFKSSDAYAALSAAYEARRQEMLATGGICDDFPALITLLENELKRRIQGAGSSASSSPYYGYIPLDLTNDTLLQSFSSMIHQDKTRVTTLSMVNFFMTIAELATDDGHGNRDMSRCDRGFAGRIAAAAACLAIEGQNPLTEIEVTFRRRIADEVANRTLRRGTESSMQFANLPYIMYELGLGPQPAADNRNRNDSVIIGYMTAFAKEYTPAALYEEYYQAMLNNFKAFAVDEPTEEDIINMHKLFQMLGFTSSREGDVSADDVAQLDRVFRMDPDNPDSKWNISKFTYHLPEKLIETLIINQLLTPNHARREVQELVTLLRRSFAIPPTISERVIADNGFSAMSASMGFGEPRDRPPGVLAAPTIASSQAQAGGFFGGFFGAARPAETPASDAVRRVANSALTQAPSNTSYG